jgi:hypothetical protein
MKQPNDVDELTAEIKALIEVFILAKDAEAFTEYMQRLCE